MKGNLSQSIFSLNQKWTKKDWTHFRSFDRGSFTRGRKSTIQTEEFGPSEKFIWIKKIIKLLRPKEFLDKGLRGR